MFVRRMCTYVVQHKRLEENTNVCLSRTKVEKEFKSDFWPVAVMCTHSASVEY